MRLAIEHTAEREVCAARAVTLGGWLSRSGTPEEAERWLRLACDTPGPVGWRAWLELLDLLSMTGSRSAGREALRTLEGLEPPPTVRAAAEMLRLQWRPDIKVTGSSVPLA